MEKGNVISEVSPVSPESGKVEVEMDAQGLGQGRYGLRPEELDSQGRYVGELHGDGRQFGGGGVELEGSGVEVGFVGWGGEEGREGGREGGCIFCNECE